MNGTGAATATGYPSEADKSAFWHCRSAVRSDLRQLRGSRNAIDRGHCGQGATAIRAPVHTAVLPNAGRLGSYCQPGTRHRIAIASSRAVPPTFLNSSCACAT